MRYFTDSYLFVFAEDSGLRVRGVNVPIPTLSEKSGVVGTSFFAEASQDRPLDSAKKLRVLAFAQEAADTLARRASFGRKSAIQARFMTRHGLSSK